MKIVYDEPETTKPETVQPKDVKPGRAFLDSDGDIMFRVQDGCVRISVGGEESDSWHFTDDGPAFSRPGGITVREQYEVTAIHLKRIAP